MAMRVLRIAAAAAAVTFLSSCQFFEIMFSSVFPSTVALVKARADLSGQIPPGDGSAYSLRVVEAPTGSYVFVIGPQLGTSNSIAYVYDMDLNLKQTETNLAQSSGVMVDANGLIVAGSRQLNAADLSLVTTIGPTVNSSGGSGGVDGFVSSGNNIFNLGVSGTTLNYGGYNAAWTLGLALPGFPTISATMSSPQIDAVLDDGVSGGNVAIVFSQQNDSTTATCYFATTAKAAFSSGGIATNIVDTSPHRDNMEKECFGFAQGSIFGYDAGSSSFVRLDPATGNVQASYFVGADFSDTRFAYRASGGFFYGFDTKTRVLMKYAAWW